MEHAVQWRGEGYECACGFRSAYAVKAGAHLRYQSPIPLPPPDPEDRIGFAWRGPGGFRRFHPRWYVWVASRWVPEPPDPRLGAEHDDGTHLQAVPHPEAGSTGVLRRMS